MSVHKFKFETVEMSKIKIGNDIKLDNSISKNKKYQRDISPKHVKELVMKFDHNKVGTIQLSLRDDGLYYPVDGQHRLKAMQEIGFEKVSNAKVFVGLTLQEEADLYNGFAKTKKQTSIDRIRSETIAQGDEGVNVKINKIFEEHGYSLAISDAQKDKKYIRCVSTVKEVYNSAEKHGEDGILHMRKIVNLIVNRLIPTVSGTDYISIDCFQQKIIRGISKLLLAHKEEIDYDYLSEKLLKKASFAAISSRAATLRPNFKTDGDAVAAALKHYYNLNAGKRTLK